MWRRLVELFRDRVGSATLETAMLLPALMFSILGVVDVGRVMWTRNVVSLAAAEGARLAVLNEPTDAEVQALVLDRLAKGGITAAADVQVSDREPETPVTVSVGVDFRFLAISDYLAETAGLKRIVAASRMVHER